MAQGRHAKKKTKNYKATSVAGIIGLGTTGAALSAGEANAATAAEWDRVAQCESGGRWNLSYGDADSTGGLQIQDRTWADFGGTSIAPHAYQASKEQQIMIAEKILAVQGPRAWSVTWNGTCPGATLSSTPYEGSQGGAEPPATQPPRPRDTTPTTKPQEPGKGSRDYVVKRGDWLAKIAKREMGSPKWQALYDANRKVIGSNPNLILPGQKLKLPGKAVAKSVQKPKASGYVLPVAGHVGDSLIIGAGGSMSRTAGGHSGLDITAPQGTPVAAAAAGTVVSMNSSGGAYGLHVVVKHGEGLYTLYAHLSAISVSMGQSVSAGAQVGNVGSTGSSGGPHLHFEVRNHPTAFNAGVFINPLTWLRSHGVSI